MAESTDSLTDNVLNWVLQNKDVDDEDISLHFNIPLYEAVEIVEDLLNQGLLMFSDLRSG